MTGSSPGEPDPADVALAFIAGINAGDVDALGALMTDSHWLKVFDEPRLIGRDANVDAWRGYVESFPHYRILPQRLANRFWWTVTVLGTTTGSHLELPDEEEAQQTIIWVAEVQRNRLRSWRLLDDSPERRECYGIETELEGWDEVPEARSHEEVRRWVAGDRGRSHPGFADRSQGPQAWSLGPNAPAVLLERLELGDASEQETALYALRFFGFTVSERSTSDVRSFDIEGPGVRRLRVVPRDQGVSASSGSSVLSH